MFSQLPDESHYIPIVQQIYSIRSICFTDADADTQDQGNQSDAEDQTEEDEGEMEAKWRMERLEREKFLQQQKVFVVAGI